MCSWFLWLHWGEVVETKPGEPCNTSCVYLCLWKPLLFGSCHKWELWCQLRASVWSCIFSVMFWLSHDSRYLFLWSQKTTRKRSLGLEGYLAVSGVCALLFLLCPSGEILWACLAHTAAVWSEMGRKGFCGSGSIPPCLVLPQGPPMHSWNHTGLPSIQ